MKRVVLFVLIVVFECDGHSHRPLFGLPDLFVEKHKQVHDAVRGVAGSVLGGFDFGLHLNVGAKTEYHQTEKPPETVVIIVEKPSENNIPGANGGQGHPNNFDNPYQPQYPQNEQHLPNQGNYHQNGNLNNEHLNQQQNQHHPDSNSNQDSEHIPSENPNPVPTPDKTIHENKTTTDGPLLVPLNPNDVNDGDKKDVAAPKRQVETSDDDFPIDIRFQDDD